MSNAAPEAFRQQIRAYVRERRAAGNEYVKSHHIAEEFDVPIQKVSTNVAALVDDGTLSVWGSNNPGNANTYVIEDV